MGLKLSGDSVELLEIQALKSDDSTEVKCGRLNCCFSAASKVWSAFWDAMPGDSVGK